MFVFGIALFTFASFLGGLATSSWWLLAARALQGVGGAIASPTALSLITTNFEEGAERNRAFGVFAAVSGSGAAIGLLAGGMLTSWASWRWVLFVNVPIGIFIAMIARQYINESEKHPGRFDLVGAITSTLGMTALVYAFIRASGTAGWGDSLTLLCFAAAAVLLVWFVINEMRSPQPITPLHMFKNRNRSGSYVGRCCSLPARCSRCSSSSRSSFSGSSLQPVEDRLHLPAAECGHRGQRPDLREAAGQDWPEAVHGGGRRHVRVRPVVAVADQRAQHLRQRTCSAR